MGQKVDPRAIRIGINKYWNSIWYAEGKEYVDAFVQDRKAREYVKTKLENAGVEKVIVKRYLNKITVEIIVARPGVVIGRAGAEIEILKSELNKIFKSKVDVKVLEAKNPDVSARLIAQNIKGQLTRRIAPKFAMSRELEKAKSSGSNIKGIRIWVSGRIRGAEIARTEKVQWGTIPLSTLRADIDYAKETAQVPNAGLQGIKVWVYKGEKSEVEYRD